MICGSAVIVTADELSASTHERWECGGWLEDDAGQLTAKCPVHGAKGYTRAQADAIRAVITARADERADPFVIEELVRGRWPMNTNELGGIVRGLVGAGVLVRVGSAQSERESRHGAAVALWVGKRWTQGQPPLWGRDGS